MQQYKKDFLEFAIELGKDPEFFAFLAIEDDETGKMDDLNFFKYRYESK